MNKPFRAARKTGLIVVSVFLAAILFLFHSLSPLALDDYGFLVRLQSVSDIFTKSVYQYYTWDGRLTGYILNHIILYIPIGAANVLLVAVQVGLVYVMAAHVLGEGWKERVTGAHLLGIACLLWLSTPDFGQVFLWKTGTPYIILPLLLLLFILPYRAFAESGKYSPRAFYLLIPLAIFWGLADFHNTVAVALFTMALSAFTMHKNRRWRVLPFVAPLLLLVCFVIIYKAPGNWLRIAAMNPEFMNRSFIKGAVKHLLKQGSIQLHYFWEYVLMALSIFVLLRARKNGQVRSGVPAGRSSEERPSTSLVRDFLPGKPEFMVVGFFLLSQAVQMVFIFSPSPEDRVYTSSVIFMILAALILASYAAREARLRNLFRPAPFRTYWIIASLFCLFGVSTVGLMYSETKNYTDTLDKLAASATPWSSIEVPPSPYLAGSYLFYGRQCGIQRDPTAWVNRQFAFHYKLTTIKLIPQYFSLITQKGGTGSFFGEFDNRILTFTYTPTPRNAGFPFFFAFPATPETPLEEYGVTLSERLGPDSPLFRNALEFGFDIVKPELTETTSPFKGTADIPSPDRASRGYIVHYQGDMDNVIAVVPLNAVKKSGGEEAEPDGPAAP